MDENFRYFGRNISEISNIGDNRSEINHGNSFEGKIAEKIGNFFDISPIYRYRTEISGKFQRVEHTRVGDFLLQNIENISIKYRRYIENISKNIGDISGYIEIYQKYI